MSNLVDIAISQNEVCFVRPCEDGSGIVTISEDAIRRAYCDLVYREVQARKARAPVLIAAVVMQEMPGGLKS